MRLHTKGPWHVGSYASSVVYDAGGVPIANTVTYHGRFGQETDQANAQLIASAPDLLAALRGMLDLVSRTQMGPHWPHDVDERCDAAREAVKKATSSDHGPRPRDRIREQQLAFAVKEHVKRCGPPVPTEGGDQ